MLISRARSPAQRTLLCGSFQRGLCDPSLLSFDYRPGIGFREWVKGCLPVGPSEARTVTCYLVRQLTTRTTLCITTTGRRACQPRRSCFAVLCPTLGTGDRVCT